MKLLASRVEVEAATAEGRVVGPKAATQVAGDSLVVMVAQGGTVVTVETTAGESLVAMAARGAVVGV